VSACDLMRRPDAGIEPGSKRVLPKTKFVVCRVFLA